MKADFAAEAAEQAAEHPHYPSLRHTWLHWGERPSPLLTSLLTSPPAFRLIPALSTNTGALCTSGPAMAEATKDHFAHISAAPSRDPTSV